MKQSVIKSKGLTVLSEVALSEADQMKLATKRSKKEFHSSHTSGSGDGVDIQSKVLDEQQHTVSGTNEGAGEDDEENDEHDSEDDNNEHDSENENDDVDDDQENEEEKEDEKANDDDEVSSDQKLQSNKLKEEAQAENDEFLKQTDSNIKVIIKDQVKAQVSKIMPKVEKSDIQKNLYNTLIESYNSDKDLFASYGDVVTLKRGRDDQDKDEEPSAGSNRGTKRRKSGKSAQAEEHGPRVDDLEETLHQEFNTGNDDVSPVREIIAVDERLWNPSRSQTLDRKWNKTKNVEDRPPQSWMTQLDQASGT
ncbi:hypothetical protein Tco_1056270 [Tanacetum coccineum]|uniref:Uncharacterized protein n=1 Tax=Tanacetum coccineum TaxID=301880 RepID=A0ABQ5H212_9ASTR